MLWMRERSSESYCMVPAAPAILVKCYGTVDLPETIAGNPTLSPFLSPSSPRRAPVSGKGKGGREAGRGIEKRCPGLKRSCFRC